MPALRRSSSSRFPQRFEGAYSDLPSFHPQCLSRRFIPSALLVAKPVYYVVWKYIVGFLNGVLAIA
jgi:hypothetical protein